MSAFCGIQPKRDFILVQPESVETRTPMGLVIPSGSNADYQVGVVKAVGDGRPRESSPDLIPNSVDVGQRIFYPRHSGGRVAAYDGAKTIECAMIRDHDVVAVIA